MKKIIFISMLFAGYLGTAQTFPLDFSDPLDVMEGVNGCVFTIVQDAGNDVGSVAGSGQLYDFAKLVLAQNLDLSDNNNNTITFRVKPTADYGTRTHLLKFEAGTGPNTEIAFNTSGTDWQNISLDYGAGLGNYGLMVLFTDFNNTQVGTYLFDDFAGGTNVTPDPDLEVQSPTPTTPNAEVLNIYSDTGGFTNNWNSDYTFGERTLVDTDNTSGVNEAMKIDFSIAGFGEGTNSGTVTDVTSYGFLHFDYWADANATQIRMILIEEDGSVQEYNYELSATGQQPIVTETWTGVDIPLSYYTNLGFSTDKFFQYKLGTTSDLVSDIVYFDNIYFSVNQATSLSVEEFEITNLKVYPNPGQNEWNIKSNNIITSVELIDVLGKSVLSMSPNSTIGKIDALTLSKGVYFARININGVINTIKLIKN